MKSDPRYQDMFAGDFAAHKSNARIMKILIIDDEIDLSLLLKSYFTRKNNDVTIAHSLSEGLRLIPQLKPDVLVLDNNLPDGIGWKEAPQIAAQFPDVFIYLVSAYHPSRPPMPERARFRILEKPVSLKDFEHYEQDVLQ